MAEVLVYTPTGKLFMFLHYFHMLTNDNSRIDCTDLVLGVRHAVFNGFPSWEAAWNAWFDSIREGYPRIL